MATMNPSSEKKPEFLFANCLECAGIIRIPITVRADSSLICPHCNCNVDLGTVLAQQAPEAKYADGSTPTVSPVSDSRELEPIQIETGEQTVQQDGKFVVPPQLAAGVKRRRRRRGSSSESKTRSKSNQPKESKPISEAEEIRRQRRDEQIKKEQEKRKERAERAKAAAEIQRHLPSIRHRSSSRRNTPKRNPVLEAAKIIVGGLLAVPIAYLLLMWIFFRDPLGLAPTINSAAPFLVPDAMIAVEEDLVEIPAEDKEDSFGINLDEQLVDPFSENE